MAMTVPAIGNLAAANNIARAGQQLNDSLALARQMASTRGQSVRVALYRPDNSNYSAMQVLGGNSFSNALTRPITFPENFAIVPNLSPLLDKLPQTNSGTLRLGGKQNVDYKYLTIRASGRVEPALTPGIDNYLTVARLAGTKFFTNNYTAVAIDPLNGRTTTYRP